MATIKSFTSLEQSKVLAEILPLESADMYHFINDYNSDTVRIRYDRTAAEFYSKTRFEYIPCWSFTALLDILPDGTDIMKDKTDTENEKYMCTVGVKGEVLYTFGSNPVDICVEMIEHLHGLNLL